MICLDKLKPIPEPFFLVVKKGIKILPKASSSMPLPVSPTSIMIFPASSINPFRWISFCGASSSAWMALCIRLMRTCSICVWSPKRTNSRGCSSLWSWMPWLSNWCCSRSSNWSNKEAKAMLPNLGAGTCAKLRKSDTKLTKPSLRFSMVWIPIKKSSISAGCNRSFCSCFCSSSPLSVPAREEMGAMEFMISCVRIFTKFCQASISFSSNSDWMFWRETNLKRSPRISSSIT